MYPIEPSFFHVSELVVLLVQLKLVHALSVDSLSCPLFEEEFGFVLLNEQSLRVPPLLKIRCNDICSSVGHQMHEGCKLELRLAAMVKKSSVNSGLDPCISSVVEYSYDVRLMLHPLAVNSQSF